NHLSVFELYILSVLDIPKIAFVNAVFLNRNSIELSLSWFFPKYKTVGINSVLEWHCMHLHFVVFKNTFRKLGGEFVKNQRKIGSRFPQFQHQKYGFFNAFRTVYVEGRFSTEQYKSRNQS